MSKGCEISVNRRTLQMTATRATLIYMSRRVLPGILRLGIAAHLTLCVSLWAVAPRTSGATELAAHACCPQQAPSSHHGSPAGKTGSSLTDCCLRVQTTVQSAPSFLLVWLGYETDAPLASISVYSRLLPSLSDSFISTARSIRAPPEA